MKCIECGKDIPLERIEALPDTKTCVKCSKAKPLMGLTETGELMLVNEIEKEKKKRQK